ncbi:MAG: hypothetical protein M1389_00040 [Chloroflexi bacterium]|nr:hypothetical protein [Chloroflexota bacterium]
MTENNDALPNNEPEPEMHVRPIWELRGYKTYREVDSREEWEDLVAEAGEDLDSAKFLSRMATRQPDKPARDVARVVALRRRLAKELKATSMVELMLVDLLVGNYQMQLEWWELLGMKTEVLHRMPTRSRTRREHDAVEQTYFTQLAEHVVPVLDRLNRQFLRTVKAYRDLKTSPMTVNINGAKQVNLGQQQINLASAEPEE